MKMGRLLHLLVFVFCAFLRMTEARAGVDARRVSLALSDSELSAQMNVTEKLSLLDVVRNELLSPATLEVSHEKKLHLFVFDEALQEFQHLHPEFVDRSSSKAWQVTLSLPRDGHYQVWAQGTIASDHQEFIALWPMEVYNGKPANHVPSELGDVRIGHDGNSRVTASLDRIVAGKMVMLNLRVDHLDGSSPVLTPYLGAPAHVVAVPLGAQDLVHVHPMEGAHSGELMLHSVFPKAGDYRLWIQFMDRDELKVVPLSVRVFPHPGR